MLVVLIGVINLRILAGPMMLVSLIGAIAAFILSVVLYGRLSALVQGQVPKSGVEIFRKNIKNVIVITLVFGVPVGLLGLAGQEVAMFKELLKIVIGIFTVYVLPIAFLRSEGLVSIAVGFMYLLEALKQSLPIIGLFLLGYLAPVAFALGATSYIGTSEGIYQVIPAIVLGNVIASYLGFLSFTFATSVLVGSARDTHGR